jgi:TPR repeat protein
VLGPPAPAAAPAAGELVIRVGPEIVDPIVAQPTTVAYRLTLAAGTTKDSGTLKVSRPLLGSEAASDDRPDRAAEEAAARAAAEAEAARRRAEEAANEPKPIVITPPPVVVEPRRWGPIVALLVLAMIGSVGAAWLACLLPGIGPARCAGEVASIEETADEGETPPAAPPLTSASASCSGLDAAACLAKAEQALDDGKLEPARQLFQEAAGLGSVEANNRMARMYDPETWNAQTSPVAEPDWETAVYWYEAAAKQNDVGGKAGAGRLLCQHAGTTFERKRAVEYLKAAAESGDASAKKLVAECEAKVS